MTSVLRLKKAMVSSLGLVWLDAGGVGRVRRRLAYHGGHEDPSPGTLDALRDRGRCARGCGSGGAAAPRQRARGDEAARCPRRLAARSHGPAASAVLPAIPLVRGSA